MTRHLFSFIAAFMLGCVAALAFRSGAHKPHAGQTEDAAPPVYSQMVTNPAAPAQATVPAATTLPADGPTAHHRDTSVVERKTVNSVCAICGMDVDPSIEPATYQGQLVGFGCRMCPPKFAREPDRYGPAALENRVVAD